MIGLLPIAQLSAMVPQLLRRLWHGLLSCLKTDLRVCAVAKRFFRRCSAAAECHALLHWKMISVCINQFNLALHDIWAVLNRLYCHVSHECNFASTDAK